MNDRQQWLADRRTGIGGSDVAAILGMSKWRTPLDVYLDKRGEAPERDDSEPMRWGRALEPLVRQEYADRTGRVVLAVPMMRHPNYQWMIANVDGVADGDRLLEVKTARTSMGWGEEGTDQVPADYLLQVQHYMIVTALPVADIAVLIGGSDFRIYEVRADAELQQSIIEAEGAFWERVQGGTPPDPVSYQDAVARFGGSAAVGAVVASAEAEAAHRELLQVNEAIAYAEGRAEELKAVILRELADRGNVLTTPAGVTLATWNLAKAPARFDTAAFKAAHADLYQQFTKQGEASRRLLIKKASE